jgi:hypothetical protein
MAYFTPEEIEAYHRDGFVIVSGMYKNPGEIQQWVTELSEFPEVPGKYAFYYEDNLQKKDERILSRIEYFVDYHEGLNSLVRGEEMMGRLKELFGEPAVLFKEKINFKLPGGDGFKLHQDSQAGWEDFTDYFISVLVTVDENTVENGCLELAAGLHKQGLIGKAWEPMSEEDLTGVELKAYPTQPGDVVFFGSYVPHASKPNATDEPRRNLYLTYNRASDGDFREKYFTEKRKNFPPDIERKPGVVYEFKV